MTTESSAKQNKRRTFKQNTIAIVYDFDGTLTPQPMQNYTVLPALGVTGQQFWKDVNAEIKRTGADGMLTYLRLLVEKVEEKKEHVTKKDLRSLAKGIEYFPGVDEWFDRVNQYVKDKSQGKVKIKHYIISAGLREILEGVSIKKHFEKIYASQYYFDHHDRATFPTVVINDTEKTQYLFRINKGREDPGQSINEYMPEAERPIPFPHMLYIGDGMTDVPCMTVAKNNGGHAIAVHKPATPKSIAVCRELAKASRIDYFAAADYSKGSVLENRIFVILDLIIARIMFAKEKFSFSRELEWNDLT